MDTGEKLSLHLSPHLVIKHDYFTKEGQQLLQNTKILTHGILLSKYSAF